MIKTLSDLFTALSAVNGFANKVAYNHFPADGIELPAMVYFVTSSANFAADNRVYKPIQRIELQLITATKEPTTEELVEAKLNECELVWQKTETFLEDEKCYEILYTFDL